MPFSVNPFSITRALIWFSAQSEVAGAIDSGRQVVPSMELGIA
jgi:hypothetical protein